MDRRQFSARTWPGLALLLTALHQRADALSLADLSHAEAAQGLTAALEQGARAAVSLLGRPDGFLGNDKIRIALPGYLADAAKLLRALGQGRRIDELVTAMNRGAEAAVPMAQDLLVGAVRSMNVGDAKKILLGGNTAATAFFAEKTRAPLGLKFLPIVTEATAKAGLAEKYNRVAARAADLRLVKKEDATIEQYVTGKTLDGLYWMIGEQEKKIRQDPVGSGSALLQKVFGALK